jgi:hypothetical protein
MPPASQDGCLRECMYVCAPRYSMKIKYTRIMVQILC